MTSAPNLSRAQVLIIDDSSAILDIVVQVLLGFGVSQMHTCLSVEEAQLKCRIGQYDLILCDSDMPGDDGYAFARWLRSEAGARNAEAPLIILSSHPSDANVRLARDCGANFTIAKPVTPAVLLSKIIWITRDERLFVKAPDYRGPDRRAKLQYPNPGRRPQDEEGVAPDLVGTDLSQSSIDDLFD